MIHIIKKWIPQSFRDRHRSSWRRLEDELLKYKLMRYLFRPPFPKLDNGEVYLHLGCGSIDHPKFINIDAVVAPHIHYVHNIDNLSFFDDESIDLIYASHCLEHFSHRKVPSVLEEWYRTLKKCGILRLSVPDFDRLLVIYTDNGKDINYIMNPLMGGQEYKYNFHYTAFTKDNLIALLKNANFHNIREWDINSKVPRMDDWSNRTITVNGRDYSLSLNLEAEK